MSVTPELLAELLRGQKQTLFGEHKDCDKALAYCYDLLADVPRAQVLTALMTFQNTLLEQMAKAAEGGAYARD